MKFAAVGLMGLVSLSVAVTAPAGVTVLLADRDQNKIWRLTDLNDNGAIDGDELFLWYDGTGPFSVGVPDNLNAFFASPDGRVIGGDQVLRLVYQFQDLNNDGDAMDAGESRLLADTTNASGASTTFPTGGAFLANGDFLLVNAGNGFGVDAIYRGHDGDADGTCQQTGELSPWVTDGPSGFGPGNGPYSPQEIVYSGTVGYLRNSSANLHGVFRFEDSTNNGRADDSGEFVQWFTGATAGFAIEPDPVRPGSLYYHQLGASSADQILRLTDGNGNGNANDAGESVLVFSTTESGFTSVDILGLPGGDVLFTDNSGKRIIRLHDLDDDGLFTSTGERTNFFVAGTSGVGDIRQIVLIPSPPLPPTCGTSDFNGDGDFGTDADIEAFFACLAGNCCPTCFAGGSDFNMDGDFGTDADIESFFRVLAGGAC